MNEVGLTPVSNQKIVPAASSKGGVEAVAEASGKELPQAKGEASKEEAQAHKIPQGEVKVEQVVASINDYVQSVHRDLQFTVDEELDKTVIKVVDGASGELIRQIPEEVFLELARKLNDGGNLQLIDALG